MDTYAGTMMDLAALWVRHGLSEEYFTAIQQRPGDRDSLSRAIDRAAHHVQQEFRSQFLSHRIAPNVDTSQRTREAKQERDRILKEIVRNHPDRARNAFIYKGWLERTPNASIRAKICEHNKGKSASSSDLWDPINTDQGVVAAAKRFAEEFGLPIRNSRRGRPSGKKSPIQED